MVFIANFYIYLIIYFLYLRCVVYKHSSCQFYSYLCLRELRIWINLGEKASRIY